ncbi:recombinase family protein [Mesorhizobium sangaii]|uniref:recombinase family protein n=1 Tax=Mesorhizobium sangaii TaxID=505389 RepID=UPI0016107FFD|nr:recombinase family protein [Mesorhizobium sangaii]
MRAVIYSRYSTDLQNDRSIEDQVALCTAYADRHGYQIVGRFEDRAVSGASLHGRKVFDLLAAAEQRQFDVVLTEAFDRLARDTADSLFILKHLDFLGVKLVSVNQGQAETVNLVIHGLMGQLQREEGARKVRRGMAGVVREGRNPGGRPYAYRPVAGQVGRLEVVEEEAAVVRRIYAEFLAGNSSRTIAHGLNRDSVPPPRRSLWNASTIHGNAKRGIGILNNTIYDGRLTWNKLRMEKNPDTGKRVSRENPFDQRQEVEVADLRILDAGVFEAARVRREATRKPRPEMHRRPKRLLSGLLRCGVCGSGMSTSGKDKSSRVRIRCSAHRESGNCPDAKTCYLDSVEELVVGALIEELREPRKVTLFIETYVAERKRLVASSQRNRSTLGAKLARVQRETDRLVDFVAKGLFSEEEVQKQLPALRAEKQLLQQELESVPHEVETVVLHQRALSQFEVKLARLRDELQRGIDDGNSEGAAAIRELVDSVTVYPNRKGGVSVSIRGKLDALVGARGFGNLGVVNGGSGGPFAPPSTLGTGHSVGGNGGSGRGT